MPDTRERLAEASYTAWLTDPLTDAGLDHDAALAWARDALVEHITRGDTPLGAGETLALRCVAVGIVLGRAVADDRIDC